MGKKWILLLEYPNGHISGVEVKARAAVTEEDFHGLKELHRQTDSDFMCGVVLYRGPKTIPFGDRLWAVPVDAMWE